MFPTWKLTGFEDGWPIFFRLIVILSLISQWPAITSAPVPDSQKKEQLRGRIVCLAEEMQKSFGVVVPASHEHLLGFKTADGKYFTLIRTRTSEALFMDKRLLEKDLILIGRTLPDTRIFDTFSIRSVKGAKIYELYYYCDICAIKAVSPEECQCCRGPVRLVEKPLGDSWTDDR